MRKFVFSDDRDVFRDYWVTDMRDLKGKEELVGILLFVWWVFVS